MFRFERGGDHMGFLTTRSLVSNLLFPRQLQEFPALLEKEDTPLNKHIKRGVSRHSLAFCSHLWYELRHL